MARWLSKSGSESSVSTSRAESLSYADAMRLTEMHRYRWFAAFVGSMLAVATVAAPWLGGDDVGRVLFQIAGGLCMCVCAAAIVSGRSLADYRTSMGNALAQTCAVTVCFGYLFFGWSSSVTLFVSFGLYVYCQSESFVASLITFLIPSVCLLVVGGLTGFGLVPDPGLVQPTSLAVCLSSALVLFVSFAGSYMFARRQRADTVETYSALEDVIREMSKRQALLDEARSEIDRAERVGGPGRFTGETFGTCVLGDLIGRGGMGDVYEAETVSGRPAAVKLLNKRALSDPSVVQRFLRESRLMVGLRSEHVVRLIELPDPEAPIPYIAMERLHGKTLSQVLREEKRLDRKALRTLADELADGLQAAHDADIVHRDLKPANIFRHRDSSGRHTWKILDFGVSKLGETSSTMSHGQLIGTPAFMAPEQTQSIDVDQRADVYAFGAILYRCLTGQPAFSGPNIPAVLLAVQKKMPPRPSEFSRVTKEMDAVFSIALAKNRRARFGSARELRSAFIAALGGEILPEHRSRGAKLQRVSPWQTAEPHAQGTGVSNLGESIAEELDDEPTPTAQNLATSVLAAQALDSSNHSSPRTGSSRDDKGVVSGSSAYHFADENYAPPASDAPGPASNSASNHVENRSGAAPSQRDAVESGHAPANGEEDSVGGSAESADDSQLGKTTTVAANALLAHERRRYRWFAGYMSAMILLCLIPTWFIAGSPVRAIYQITCVLCGAICAAVVFLLRGERPYRLWHSAVLAIVCSALSVVTFFYWGIFSGMIFPVAMSLYVFCQSRNAFAARVTMVVATGTYAALSTLQFFGLYSDTGVIQLTLGDRYATLLLAALIFAIHVGLYFLARRQRADATRVFHQLEEATAEVSRRHALLEEARAEIERVVRVGRPGRFTGQSFGEFLLGDLLGRGAMGDVYEAVGPADTPAAVKLLHMDSLSNRDAVNRFFLEAELLHSLESEYVVSTIAPPDRDASLPFIAMERLRGRTLSDRLRTEPVLSDEVLVRMVIQISRGLAAAHEAGVVHCDLKPANIYEHRASSGKRVWKLLDFGASTLEGRHVNASQSRIVGTPAFMAPEQATGRRVDYQADLYALGAIVYRCITGRPMFTAPDIPSLLFSIAHQMPPRPSDVLSVNPAFDAVLAVALAKQPEHRFESAAAFARAIRDAARGEVDEQLARRARALLNEADWGGALQEERVSSA